MAGSQDILLKILVVGGGAFALGYFAHSYLTQDFKSTKREEQLFREVGDPSIKKAWAILRSEREELLAQLQESDAKAKKVISEIRSEREELLSQLLDKADRWTLTYFDARGRAEQIRLLFAECGVTFTNTRIKREDWIPMKGNTPMGNIPVLEHNGKSIGESIAQMVYVAKVHDRWPKKVEAEATALMVICAADDIRRDLTVATFASPHDKIALTEKLFTHLEEKLSFFEKLLEPSGFFVTSRVTAADIALWDLLDQIVLFNGKAEDILVRYKDLSKWRNRIAELPNVAKYLKERK